MEERSGESEDQGFLPPEPAGPEPELGGRPPQAPPVGPQPPGAQPPPPPGYGHPPPPQPTYGYPPPAPGQAYPPPPGYGHQPPPPGYAQPWGYAPQPQVPDNGQAVAGFVFSLVSIGLLVISAGLSTIVSIGCAIPGIICSRNGKKKVDAGETPKHRGLAQAGFIIGWVALVLSLLATIAWILILVLAATDNNSGDDPFETVRAARQLVGA